MRFFFAETRNRKKFLLKFWNPSNTDKLLLKQEKDNKYDIFAVCVKCHFKSKIVPIIVGHVPIDISRYVYFSLEHGAVYTFSVLESKPLRSALTKGGLEVEM